MALYTGKGDSGTTKLFDSKQGKRESKSSYVFEVLGTVDELNTVLGWCRSACTVDWMARDKSVSTLLRDTQHHIFTIQAELAGAKKHLSAKHVSEVEEYIDTIEAQLPEITSFLVPGGDELAVRLDIARTVARRAERRLIQFFENDGALSEHTLAYANRLSSLLYALVRLVNHKSGAIEEAPEYAG